MVSAVKISVDENDKIEKIDEQQNQTEQKQKITLSKYFGSAIVVAILLEATLIGVLFFMSPSQAQLTIKQTNTKQINVNADKILKLINQERSKHNLQKLTTNKKLNKAARIKAEYIFNNQHFAHSSISGQSFSTWIKAQNYKYMRIGENLAINFSDETSAVKAWLTSPKHRQNILNPYYQETGLVAMKGLFQNKETIVIVQIFGEPFSK